MAATIQLAPGLARKVKKVSDALPVALHCGTALA